MIAEQLIANNNTSTATKSYKADKLPKILKGVLLNLLVGELLEPWIPFLFLGSLPGHCQLHFL